MGRWIPIEAGRFGAERADLLGREIQLRGAAIYPTVTISVRRLQPFRLVRQPAGKSLFSLVALAIYLFVAALAASPELHHLFSHDADDPDHQCAATVLAQGQLDATPAMVTVVVPSAVGQQTLPAQPLGLAAPDFWLLPERAPPVSLA